MAGRWIGAALCALPVIAFGQGRPPTLDPTYGMPVPKMSRTAHPAPRDSRWIWAAQTRDQQTIFLRHPLHLAHGGRAHVFITCDNFFTLYVNGQQVGATAPDPKNDSVWQQVHDYDISAMVHAGDNEIAVQAVNAGSIAGLLLRVEQDRKPILYSDSSWKVLDAPAADGWQQAAFDDSSWTGARDEGPAGMDPWGGQIQGWPADLDAVPDYLFHLPIAPVKVSYAPDIDHLQWSAANRQVRMARPAGSSGHWAVILDFGKELTGRVIVEKYAGELQIGTGESTGEAIEKPWKTSNSSPSPYGAFRYAVIKLPADAARFDADVHLDHLYYPVRYLGSFDCSDPLLTKIWYTGAYTAHLCMQQDIWDAPKRDRARWMGDLHVSGEVIDNVFADKFLMEQTIRRLREDAQGGRPADALPGGNVNGIPGYSCAWIAGMADLYRHIGDRDFLESQHQALLTLIDYLHGEEDERGVFANKHGQWPFVDWSPDFDGDHPEARLATQMFMVKAAREAAFLLTELGDTDNAAKCAQWAKDLTGAAQQYLLAPDGTFGNRRQSNAMAIYAGAATPAEEKAIYENVLNPASPAWNIVATPYYNNYVLFALGLSGHTQDAVNFIRSYWGGMLAEGATSWWEGYDPSWDKNNFHVHLQADDGTGYFVSLSHGWSAGPTNFLTERVLGIRSTGEGFKTCVVAPELGDLQWVSGGVPTPNGVLRVRAARAVGGLTVTVEVPKGVSATVVPGGTIAQADGKPASGNQVVLGPGSHTVVAGSAN